MNIKNKIIKWLLSGCISKIEREISCIREEREQLRETIHNFYSSKNSIDYAMELVQQCVDVGVDVHLKSDSWAVVCLKGRPDYIKIMELDSSEAREIQRFLRSFKEARVDASPHYYKILKDL